MHAHLVRDLRLLWRVLQRTVPPQNSDALLEPVLAHTTRLATEVLSALCAEHAAAAVAPPSGLLGGTQLAPSLPDLELFASPATLAEAPLGVRARSEMTSGELLGFYPGRLFLREEQNLPRSDMLFGNGYEGVSFDGMGWLPQHWKEDPLLAGWRKSPTTLWHGNRLAIANLLNHPSQGVLPNCVPMAFHWPTWQELGQGTPAYWARLVPHVVMSGGKVIRTASGEKTPADGSTEREWFPPWPHMGLALITIRKVCPGEEFCWNYRLHPRADAQDDAKYPDWYTPVNDDELEVAVATELG